MDSKTSDTDDLISALSTPWGYSALAVVRTSGQGCIEAVESVFRGKKRLSECSGNSMIYGRLLNPVENIIIDEIMAGVFRAPKSYTGQDMVEIYCHGSIPCIQSVLDILKKTGFRDAEPGEFTLRAFLNGKMDLTRAEAVNDIINAKTERARNLALSRLSGSIEKLVNTAKNETAELLTAVELQLDYPEDEADPEGEPDFGHLQKAVDILEKLSSTFREGKVIQEGVKAVLTGKTNAGKSALFNLLTREERSIVSDHHGTTRDYIESFISIRGIPVRIYDTAGLRHNRQLKSSPVEAEGIKRSSMITDNSDVIIYIVDSTQGFSMEDKERIACFDADRTVKVWNKVDLKEALTPEPEGFVPVSAVTGEGLGLLEDEITGRIGSGSFSTAESGVIDSERQKYLIDSALASLYRVREAVKGKYLLDVIAVDLRDALDSLGEITGEITNADILDMIFSKFCVGK